MVDQLVAFWCGGAVCCLLLTTRLLRPFSCFLFALGWPITVPVGMWMTRE